MLSWYGFGFEEGSDGWGYYALNPSGAQNAITNPFYGVEAGWVDARAAQIDALGVRNIIWTTTASGEAAFFHTDTVDRIYPTVFWHRYAAYSRRGMPAYL